MVKNLYAPERGDVIWLDFNPSKGHEQRGIRPAVVLSLKSYNQLVGLVLVCPITSQEKGYPFEERVVVGKISGVALTDQIKSVDWKVRKIHFIGKLPQEIFGRILLRSRSLVT